MKNKLLLSWLIARGVDYLSILVPSPVLKHPGYARRRARNQRPGMEYPLIAIVLAPAPTLETVSSDRIFSNESITPRPIASPKWGSAWDGLMYIFPVVES